MSQHQVQIAFWLSGLNELALNAKGSQAAGVNELPSGVDCIFPKEEALAVPLPRWPQSTINRMDICEPCTSINLPGALMQ